ncbi:hypothetical protein QUA54_28335 [Microcoleus sp. MOSTC5]|uniref:hypothetical protein n=1 Tax=unclassified Microcoleus TaxID=2642155 RepID=UPI002FCE9EE4
MQVKCSPYKYLQTPDFILQTPDFILQTPDFRAHKKSANFFGGGFDRRCEWRTDKSAGGRSSYRIKPITWFIPCQHEEIKKRGNDRQSA